MNQEPSLQAAASSRVRVLSILALVSGAIATIVGGYWLWQSPAMRMGANALFMPKELRSLSFISGAPETAGVYVRSGWSYTRFEIAPGRTDVVRRGESIASAGPAGDGGYEVRLNDAVLYATASVIRDVDLSADGSAVLFSEMQDGDETMWIVRRATAEGVTEIGPGFAGYFMDTDTVLVFGAEGVARYELGTGAVATVLPYPLPAPVATAVHRENSIFAFADAVSRDVLVFRIGVDGAVSAVGGYDVPAAAPLALTESALYWLEQAPDPGTVYKQSFDSGERTSLYTLYRPLNVSRLTN